MDVFDLRKIVNPATGGVALATLALFKAATDAESLPVMVPLMAWGLILTLYSVLREADWMSRALFVIWAFLLAHAVTLGAAGLADLRGIDIASGPAELSNLANTLTTLSIVLLGCAIIFETFIKAWLNGNLDGPWRSAINEFGVYVLLGALLVIVAVAMTT